MVRNTVRNLFAALRRAAGPAESRESGALADLLRRVAAARDWA